MATEIEDIPEGATTEEIAGPAPRTEYDGQLPHKSYYYTSIWGSYKGFVKGGLGGLVIGAGLGAVIGVLGAAIVVPFIGFSWALLGAGAAAVSAVGAFKGYEEFSQIGKTAGAVGVALDEYERRHDKVMDYKFRQLGKKLSLMMGKEKEFDTLSEQEQKLAERAHKEALEEERTRKHTPHMDAATAPTIKPFHWKVAVAGLIIGAAAAALISGGAALVIAGGAAAKLGFAASLIEGIAHAPAISAVFGGLFGASFGLDRKFFRGVFDYTDTLFSGDRFSKKPPRLSLIGPEPEIDSLSSTMATRLRGGGAYAVSVEDAKKLESRLKTPEIPNRWQTITSASKELQRLDTNGMTMQ